MKIIGVGDHILDVIYKTNNKKPLSFAYDGGGTVWNILANLSHFFKYETYCIGAIGKDWVGDKIKESLIKLDINIDYCGSVKYSKIAHISIPQDQLFVSDEAVVTSLTCPICKSSNKGSTTVFPDAFPENLVKEKDVIVCFESLKNNILQLKDSAIKNGWKTAADIGFIGYLRYLDENSIKEKLSNINYLQLHGSVGRFLLNKFSINSYSDLRKILDCTILCVTKGREGCIFSIEEDQVEHELIPDIIEDVIDGTGAGDAFFSGVIHTYLFYTQSGKKIDSLFIKEAFNKGNEIARKVVKEIGARGHIKQLHFNKIESESEICASCSNRITKKKTNYFDNKKVQRLYERSTFQEKKLGNISFFEKIRTENLSILIIGSGGSYSAASFAYNIINNYTKSLSLFIHPGQITDKLYTKFDYIVLFSYSGKTSDILNIIDKINANRDKNTPSIILFTLEIKKEILDSENIKLISYKDFFNDCSKEKGFLSFSGTMNPISIFQKFIFCYNDKIWNHNLITEINYWSSFFDENKSILHRIQECKSVDIFYDNYSYPAAIDIESKFTESGISRALLHEKKDFSHGRFSVVNNIKSDLIIFINNENSKYENILIEYLKNHTSIEVIIINTNIADYKEYSYMLMSQILFIKISEHNKNVNLEPNYPEEALELYKFKKFINLL